MHRAIAISFLLLMVTATRPFAQTAAKTLDIYYIDTEGGQATLFVSPTGQSVLVDTGNAGTRDPERIVEATKAAGVKQIDYLVITHDHGDHIGGFLELAKLIPIMHYVDHGPTVQPEQNTPAKQAYDAACPTNHVGTVDVYLTTHHGLDQSNSKQVIHALQPRVAIMNNGTHKGGQLESYQTL